MKMYWLHKIATTLPIDTVKQWAFFVTEQIAVNIGLIEPKGCNLRLAFIEFPLREAIIASFVMVGH